MCTHDVRRSVRTHDVKKSNSVFIVYFLIFEGYTVMLLFQHSTNIAFVHFYVPHSLHSTNAGDFVQRTDPTNNSNSGTNNTSSSNSGVVVGGSEMEVVSQYDAAARSINAVATTGAFVCCSVCVFFCVVL